MSHPEFEIEIMTQGWIGPTQADAEYDLCSHGDIRVVIGGCVVAPGDGERDYTISTSALALLRTLESDHSPEAPVADGLVMHCGMLFMVSCPIGIDWSVSHLGGRVRLHEVVRCDDIVGELRFPELEVELGEDEYRRQVVAFAEKAKQFFEGVDKARRDDIQGQLHEEFWQEYNARLRRARR
jgi:hypothetical protein